LVFDFSAKFNATLDRCGAQGISFLDSRQQFLLLSFTFKAICTEEKNCCTCLSSFFHLGIGIWFTQRAVFNAQKKTILSLKWLIWCFSSLQFCFF